MKVIHIVRQFSPSIGGLESAVLNLAGAQRRQLQLDAQVVTLNSRFGRDEVLPRHARIGSIPVTRIPWRGSTRYPVAPSVLRLLGDADLVHVHAVDFFFDYLAATKFLHRRKLVASTHGGFFHTQQQAGLKKLYFNTVTRASALAYDRIIACSHSDAEMFSGIGGARLQLIENGIEQARFVQAASPAQNRVLICFGRFAKHKRIAAIFPLLRQLRSLHPDWQLIVAGRESDQTLAELQNLAAESGVTDAVTFALDPGDDALRALIGQASYFACFSAYEGFGLAAVEAMSAGLFPILSDIAPFRRLHEETGLGLISGDLAPEPLAAAVEARVLSDAGHYGLRQMQLADAVRRYDWDNAAVRYLDTYEQVLGATVKQPSLAYGP